MALSETYQLINEYGKNFNSIWNNTLKPEFLKHEEFRKSELASFRSTEYLYVALFIFCVIWLVFSFKYVNLFVPILSVISVILLWQIITLPQKADKKFTSKIKSLYLETVMNAFAGIKRVSATDIGGGDKSRLKKSELFADFTFLDVDDAFAGIHKGVKFGVAELRLSDYFDKHRIIKLKVFGGVVLSFQANKNIKNKTMVSTRGDFKIKGLPICLIIVAVVMLILAIIYKDIEYLYYAICGMITAFLTQTKKPEVINEIILEDPRFMKRYKAFSSDEVEGRYLLTTAFMERLNNVRTAFGTNNLKCSFVDDRFIVAIAVKEDLFEICSLFTPMDNPKHLSKFYNQIVAVLLMSDYFKLDEKTGL